MFSLKKLAGYLLYQPPRLYVPLFEAGLEDRVGKKAGWSRTEPAMPVQIKTTKGKAAVLSLFG